MCGHRAMRLSILVALGAACLALSCGERPGAAGGEVVVYTALDEVFSEPILKDFGARR